MVLATRLVRPGAAKPKLLDIQALTPGQRMERVWTLTQLCLAMRGEQSHEPRLQRSVVRIQRARR